MKRYKTLKGWLNAVKRLADHPIDGFKECENEEISDTLGYLMAHMYEDHSNINELIKTEKEIKGN